MGHLHLGQLATSANWEGLVTLLGTPGFDIASVATATGVGARARIAGLRKDPSLGYCFWLLSRLASAARRPEFTDSVGRLGLDVAGSDSVLSFVSLVGDQVRDEVRNHPESGPFGELAADALTRALTETVGTEGRSLFGSSVEDLERALRKHSTPDRFAVIARRFFGDFVARTLRFYIGKELPKHVGSGAVADVGQSAAFVADLDRYTREVALIVERYAAEWFDKYDGRTDGTISRDQAQQFVSVAVGKLRDELQVTAR
jgi:hypothetical protein